MKLLDWFFTKCVAEWWNIGFITDFDLDTIFEHPVLNIQWVKTVYNDRWFADPFILQISDQSIVVLAEEFYVPSKKGRITKLVINRKSLEIESATVILELESHLSFPIIFRHDEEIYIYPENSSMGNLTVYNYNERDNQTNPVSVVINEPLTDAVITTDFNIPYLFSTKISMPNGSLLHIYKSDKWDGEYQFDQSVQFSDNTARNAGNIFKADGKWIRPAQDCNGEYGKGLVFQEIIYNENKFSFQELKRFYPVSKKWNMGLHTFNFYDNIAVVDGKRYKRAFLRNIYIHLSSLRKKLLKQFSIKC